MQIFKRISIAYIIIFMFGCSLFDTKKVSDEEIRIASSWTNNDQPPSFEECNELDPSNQKECFEELLLKAIHSSLKSLSFESSEPISSIIDVEIKIDENGLFSLVNFSDPDHVFKKIVNLKDEIITIVNSLPKALPAIKTNTGFYVNVKFTIPVEIEASLTK